MTNRRLFKALGDETLSLLTLVSEYILVFKALPPADRFSLRSRPIQCVDTTKIATSSNPYAVPNDDSSLAWETSCANNPCCV